MSMRPIDADARHDGANVVADETFDYVIVGAGSAGCVLADRLSADGAHRVLLLEYGGSDRSIFIQMPSALSIPMNMPKYNWFYHTEPEPHLDGRRMHTPRGKVLGGSSSINGLVYIRGNPHGLRALGSRRARRGWSLPRRAAVFQARRERARRAATSTVAAPASCSTRYGTAQQSAARGLARRRARGRLPADRRTSTAFSRKASAAWT